MATPGISSCRSEISIGPTFDAANIDPGWTHVFPMLAGLIAETGGVLSHGALLAREYGIPAVMGTSGAVGWIEDIAL